MSAVDRLSEDNFRELARLIRRTHARSVAKREARLRREQNTDKPANSGGSSETPDPAVPDGGTTDAA